MVALKGVDASTSQFSLRVERIARDQNLGLLALYWQPGPDTKYITATTAPPFTTTARAASLLLDGPLGTSQLVAMARVYSLHLIGCV